MEYCKKHFSITTLVWLLLYISQSFGKKYLIFYFNFTLFQFQFHSIKAASLISVFLTTVVLVQLYVSIQFQFHTIKAQYLISLFPISAFVYDRERPFTIGGGGGVGSGKFGLGVGLQFILNQEGGGDFFSVSGGGGGGWIFFHTSLANICINVIKNTVKLNMGI